MTQEEKIYEGDSDMVAEVMAKAVGQIALLIEGGFLDSFEISFGVDEKKFQLILKNITDDTGRNT